MGVFRKLNRHPWRVLAGAAGFLLVAYLAWSPGKQVRDGRHNLDANGIWIGHGWLGEDAWFARYNKDKNRFRDPVALEGLAEQLRMYGIRYVFPHLCPCAPDGTIAEVDSAQTERLLDHFTGLEVLPWIGGVNARHCQPHLPRWRKRFVESAVALLQAHPRLSGLHLNIEPMRSGDPDYLLLLEELRQALPPGRKLSVAAYPPPTRWQPIPEVHWDEVYFREVAARVDQLVPMLYDTAIPIPKFYEQLMTRWTREVLTWAGDTPVLLGVPAYDDAGTGYHHPHVENLPHALRGIHAGLSTFPTLPACYQGLAIYCNWEMDSREWGIWRKEFL